MLRKYKKLYWAAVSGGRDYGAAASGGVASGGCLAAAVEVGGGAQCRPVEVEVQHLCVAMLQI